MFQTLQDKLFVIFQCDLTIPIRISHLNPNLDIFFSWFITHSHLFIGFLQKAWNLEKKNEFNWLKNTSSSVKKPLPSSSTILKIRLATSRRSNAILDSFSGIFLTGAAGGVPEKYFWINCSISSTWTLPVPLPNIIII